MCVIYMSVFLCVCVSVYNAQETEEKTSSVRAGRRDIETGVRGWGGSRLVTRMLGPEL